MSDLNELDAVYEQAEPLEPDIPPGEYVARAVSVQYVTSVCTGARGLCVRLEVQEGPYAGRCLWDDLWLKGGALRISKRNLELLGFTAMKPTEILAYQNFDQLPSVLVRVKHEVYEGRNRVVVSSFRRKNGRTGTTTEGGAFP